MNLPFISHKLQCKLPGRIRDEIRVGHRYHGVMTLAIYAKKCGIEETELRQGEYFSSFR